MVEREIAKWKVWKRDIEGKFLEVMGEMAQFEVWKIEMEKPLGKLKSENENMKKKG